MLVFIESAFTFFDLSNTVKMRVLIYFGLLAPNVNEYIELDATLSRKIQFLEDFFSDICPLITSVHNNSSNF